MSTRPPVQSQYHMLQTLKNNHFDVLGSQNATKAALQSLSSGEKLIKLCFKDRLQKVPGGDSLSLVFRLLVPLSNCQAICPVAQTTYIEAKQGICCTPILLPNDAIWGQKSFEHWTELHFLQNSCLSLKHIHLFSNMKKKTQNHMKNST